MDCDKSTKKEQRSCCSKTFVVNCNISGTFDEKKLVKDITCSLAHQKKNQVFGH